MRKPISPKSGREGGVGKSAGQRGLLARMVGGGAFAALSFEGKGPPSISLRRGIGVSG